MGRFLDDSEHGLFAPRRYTQVTCPSCGEVIEGDVELIIDLQTGMPLACSECTKRLDADDAFDRFAERID